MYNSYNENTLDCWEFEELPTDAIILSSQDINQAVEISRQISNEWKQWHIYRNSLAFFAFKQWLEERGDSLTINQSGLTVLQPQFASVINAGCNLQIGEFKVCLIAVGSLTDELIALPKPAVDIPEFIPHFYVLVEVLVEQAITLVSGFISYKQLLEYRENSNIQPESDWNYQIPLSWFDNNPNRLLLYLRCLSPEAIALPSLPNRVLTSAIQNELIALLPQLSGENRELWEVLTWEQAVIVFTTPELINWVYKAQLNPEKTPEEAENERIALSDLLKLLTQPALNVGYWLRNQLDEFAQELSWVLLTSLTPTSALRSAAGEFAAIVRQLYRQGLEIPPHARVAYQDLILPGIPLRLYAVTWDLVSGDKYEWTLLVILGTINFRSIPLNLKLRVSDKTGILVNKGREQNSVSTYLFARVVGDIYEKFLVSVSLSEGAEVTLPPFMFDVGWE